MFPYSVIFLVFALVLFILAAINVPSPKCSLGWAGMVFITLYLLLVGGIFHPH